MKIIKTVLLTLCAGAAIAAPPDAGFQIDLATPTKKFEYTTFAGNTPSIPVTLLTNNAAYSGLSGWTAQLNYGMNDAASSLKTISGSVSGSLVTFTAVSNSFPVKGDFFAELFFTSGASKITAGQGVIHVQRSPSGGSYGDLNLSPRVNWDITTSIGTAPWTLLTEPVFLASVAYGITAVMTNQWSEAYLYGPRITSNEANIAVMNTGKVSLVTYNSALTNQAATNLGFEARITGVETGKQSLAAQTLTNTYFQGLFTAQGNTNAYLLLLCQAQGNSNAYFEAFKVAQGNTNVYFENLKIAQAASNAYFEGVIVSQGVTNSAFQALHTAQGSSNSYFEGHLVAHDNTNTYFQGLFTAQDMSNAWFYTMLTNHIALFVLQDATNVVFQGLFDAQANSNAYFEAFKAAQGNSNAYYQGLWTAQGATNIVFRDLHLAQADTNAYFQSLHTAQGNSNAYYEAFKVAQAATNAAFSTEIRLNLTNQATTNAGFEDRITSIEDAGYVTGGTNLYKELTIADQSVLNTNTAGLTQVQYTGVVSSVAYTGTTVLVEGQIYAWGFSKSNAYGTSILSIAGCSLTATNSGAVSNYFAYSGTDTDLILTLIGDGSSKSDVGGVYVRQITNGDVRVANDLYVGNRVFINGQSAFPTNEPLFLASVAYNITAANTAAWSKASTDGVAATGLCANLQTQIVGIGGLAMFRYQVLSAANENIWVLATATNVTAVRDGTVITFTVPASVHLLSADVRWNAPVLGAAFSIKVGTNDMANTSITNRCTVNFDARTEDNGKPIAGASCDANITEFDRHDISGLQTRCVNLIKFGF